jgi:hypothetical protein
MFLRNVSRSSTGYNSVIFQQAELVIRTAQNLRSYTAAVLNLRDEGPVPGRGPAVEKHCYTAYPGMTGAFM